MAVLVNDFCAINIDSELVIGVKDDVISLAIGEHHLRGGYKVAGCATGSRSTASTRAPRNLS